MSATASRGCSRHCHKLNLQDVLGLMLTLMQRLSSHNIVKSSRPPFIAPTGCRSLYAKNTLDGIRNIPFTSAARTIKAILSHLITSGSMLYHHVLCLYPKSLDPLKQRFPIEEKQIGLLTIRSRLSVENQLDCKNDCANKYDEN